MISSETKSLNFGGDGDGGQPHGNSGRPKLQDMVNPTTSGLSQPDQEDVDNDPSQFPDAHISHPCGSPTTSLPDGTSRRPGELWNFGNPPTLQAHGVQHPSVRYKRSTGHPSNKPTEAMTNLAVDWDGLCCARHKHLQLSSKALARWGWQMNMEIASAILWYFGSSATPNQTDRWHPSPGARGGWGGQTLSLPHEDLWRLAWLGQWLSKHRIVWQRKTGEQDGCNMSATLQDAGPLGSLSTWIADMVDDPKEYQSESTHRSWRALAYGPPKLSWDKRQRNCTSRAVCG